MKRGVLLIGLLFIIISLFFVSAADLSLSVSDITPSSIEANEDFTVGIQVLNIANEDVEETILKFEYIGDDLQLKESKEIDLGFLRKNGGLKNIIYYSHAYISF